SVLAGMPGSTQGQVQLYIQSEDRLEARRLVESITGVPPAVDREQVRQEIAVTSAGLFITGLAALLSRVLGGGFVALAQWNEIASNTRRDPHWLLPALLCATVLIIVPLSALMMTGAVLMRRLRGFPLVATAAIAAMVPWSPAWPIGLIFGILT